MSRPFGYGEAGVKTRRYAIAQYLPLALRRKMARPAYDRDGIWGPVCATGRCPLGWLFAAPSASGDQKVPEAPLVVRRIKKLYPARIKDEIAEDDCYTAAKVFIKDWDRGFIKNLASALDVKSTAARPT